MKISWDSTRNGACSGVFYFFCWLQSSKYQPANPAEQILLQGLNSGANPAVSPHAVLPQLLLDNRLE